MFMEDLKKGTKKIKTKEFRKNMLMLVYSIFIIKMHISAKKEDKWKFYCKFCDYGCKSKFLMDQHKKTKKHKCSENEPNARTTEKKALKIPINQSQNQNQVLTTFKCNCGKIYRHKQSYNRHIKTCDGKSIIENSKGSLLDSVLSENRELKRVLSENQEMKKVISEFKNMIENNMLQNKEMRDLVKNMYPANNTTINNTVNIQLFLNQECKNAINLSDFINSLELGSADLKITQRNGQVAGIAAIFLKGLKDLSQDMRPIHCSDLQKEIIYVKDDGKWEKENDNKLKIKEAISTISNKQINAIKKWEEEHPNWQSTDEGTKNYCEIIQQITSTIKPSEENKIIRGIAKEVIIK